MSPPIKNILIAGAAGSVGAPILQGLLKEGVFNITILSRFSSTATFPPNIPVKQVSDAFTVAELTSAFRGQDAVVVAIATMPIISDTLAQRFVDASLAAGVRRLIPSEYGNNNLDPRARAMVPTYEMKGQALEYLIAKAKESQGKLSWTSICCGSWLDWALDAAKGDNFLSIDVKGRKATIWDSGNARFAVTTSGNVGLAVARALKYADVTENKQVFLSDFTATSRGVIGALEKEMDTRFSVEQKESAPLMEGWRAGFDAGGFAATVPLLSVTFVGDADVGYDFEGEQEVWNGKLGLPEVTLEEVVRGAVELAGRA